MVGTAFPIVLNVLHGAYSSTCNNFRTGVCLSDVRDEFARVWFDAGSTQPPFFHGYRITAMKLSESDVVKPIDVRVGGIRRHLYDAPATMVVDKSLQTTAALVFVHIRTAHIELDVHVFRNLGYKLGDFLFIHDGDAAYVPIIVMVNRPIDPLVSKTNAIHPATVNPGVAQSRRNLLQETVSRM